MMVLTLLLDVECLYSFFNSSSKDYFPESLFIWAVFIVFPSGDMNLSAGFPLFTCPSEKFKFNFVFQTKCKISNFLHLKTQFHCSFILTMFTNVSVVVVILPIMAKLNKKTNLKLTK